ncbi:hypothetical protein [Gibbsiella quercinecans]|uniref:Uncharacterized protein n=1 Tax=Gibbsiella quercinecans TaxID=929813 RepID=A0A250B5U9_9GAMM|nr:hypothetical protein [Gibbsiella quercinecans]ATA21628.1 hypothetical protein AWC35_21050 [Gibbsiella quercinecans]RLM06087.1 hypothetical protein BIY31_16225 [Gibbsiella quercinecans]RLM06243.1 hypothetical protein BIY30_16960 [Gibbsiella quercinecans]
MRAEGQNTNLSPPGNLTTGFDTIKDNIIGEWSTDVEAIEGAERRIGETARTAVSGELFQNSA